MREQTGRQVSLGGGTFEDVDNYLSNTVFVWRLVWRLFWDRRVKFKHKLLPLGALIYMKLPIDLIPERFLGPLGLADDFVLMEKSLSRFLNKVNQETGGVYAEHYVKLKGK